MVEKGSKKGLSLGIQVTLVTGCIIAVLLAVILSITSIKSEKILGGTIDESGLGFVESLQVGVAQEMVMIRNNNGFFLKGVTQRMEGQRFFDSEDTLELGGKTIQKLFFMDNGLQQVTNGQEIVAGWKKAIGIADFSMFQIIDEGLIRVASTLVDKNGESLLGQVLDKNSPEYIKTIKEGQSYEGVTSLAGELYQSNYTPIKDAAGVVRMVVFTGTPLDKVFTRIINSHIGRESYGFVFDSQGKFVVHPELSRGTSLKETSEELWAVCNDSGVLKSDKPMTISYSYQGRNSTGYVQKIAGTDWFVAIVVNHDLLMAPVASLRLDLMIWAIPLSIIGLLLLAWGVIKLVAPLKNVVSVAGHIANGDLSMEISGDDESRNEVQKVMAAFARILTSYRGLVAKIVEMNGQFADGSTKMENISNDVNLSLDSVNVSATAVSEMIDSIASAAEETNAGVEEVSSGVASSTNVITGLSEKAHIMTSNAEGGMTAVDGVTGDSRKVAEASGRVMDAIGKLESSVEGIVGFVNTIAQIADQTNLLALNAAIEAARAGDAGRGFAVVAEEVRKLAEKSNEAAGKIGTVIEEVQSSMTVAGDDSRKAGVLIDKLADRSIEAAGKIRDITDGISDMAEGIQSIAAASQEQSASTQEIAQAVGNIASMLNDGRESAIAMGETASAMEARMKDLVEIRETQQEGLKDLRDVTADYKLNSDETPALEG